MVSMVSLLQGAKIEPDKTELKNYMSTILHLSICKKYSLKLNFLFAIQQCLICAQKKEKLNCMQFSENSPFGSPKYSFSIFTLLILIHLTQIGGILHKHIILALILW